MAGIDGPAAHLSDGLFTTAISVYALAMIGYTAEFAFGRVGRKLTAVAPAEQRERELVGAGGPPSVTTSLPAEPVDQDPSTRRKRSIADRCGRRR